VEEERPALRPTQRQYERYRQSGNFLVGEVIGKSFSVFGHKLGVLLAIVVIIYSPLIVYNGIQVVGEPFPTDIVDVEADEPEVRKDVIWRSFGEMIGAALLGLIAQAAVIYGVLQELRGEWVSVGESLRVGLVRILAVLGVSFLTGICIALLPVVALVGTTYGSVLLALPLGAAAVAWVLYLMCALWVAVPVVVVERTGVFGALGRSAKLAQGQKWRILGIILILFAIQYGMGMVAMFAALASAKAGLVMEVVIALLLGSLSATIAAVGYHDLRFAKEGVGVDDLIKVFA
jgi:hypothetical protein